LRGEPESAAVGASETGRPKKATERRNVTTNYLAAVVAVLVGFFTTPILTHDLGIVRYGVWALIGSLIPFLELLELGFANVTVAFVGRHLELEEDEKVASTINTSFLILSVLGVIAFAGVVVFTIFLPDIIKTIPKSLMGQAQFLLLLFAFDMALSIPMDTFGGALCAMQRFDLLNYSLIAVIVAQAVGWVVVLVVFNGGLIALGVVTVAISLLGQVSRLVIVHRLLPWFRLSLRRFDRSLLKIFSVTSGWFSIMEFSDAVVNLGDVLIVGAAAGVRAAAIYSVALRLGQLPIKIVQPRTYLLFTRVGQLEARQKRSEIRDSTDEVVRFVQYLSIPAAIALGFLAGPAVEAWLGSQYREAVPVIGLLCLAGVVQAWALTLRLALSGTGRPKLPAILYGTEAAFHVALGIVLAARYGALGMAEAVLITVVVMEGILLLPLTYRQLGDSFLRRGARTLRTLGVPALVTGVLAWVIGRGGGPLYVFTDTHGRLLGLVAVGAAGIALLIVFYALLLFFLPPAQRQQFLARGRGMAGRLTGRRRKSVPVSPPPSPLVSEALVRAGPAGNLAPS
jgi:O-antigen/teichoic acid export membrane protein